MIGVSATVAGYRVAAAELPQSVRLVSHAADAIVVVPGSHRWLQTACAAFAADAAGVIVSDPGPFDERDVADLQDAAAGRPVIVDRPLLRADVIASVMAEGAPSYATVEVATARRRRTAVVRDAAGWMRVLLGGRCDAVSADRTASAVLALLQSEGAGGPGTLTATTIAGTDEGAWIRAVAVAATRIEVVVDEADSRASVEVATEDGVRRAARRFESHERLSLRRAIEALASGDHSTDLADLRADDVVAHAVLDVAR